MVPLFHLPPVFHMPPGILPVVFVPTISLQKNMNDDMKPLSSDDTFLFSCNTQVSCFNKCCRDLNQCLTPYDILRLKVYLNIPSNAFLKQYTRMHTGPESGLPVITLKANPNTRLKCPFVTHTGCGVYENRPSSCRMYPLMRAVKRSRESGKLTQFFALITEPHCYGFRTIKSQTVREWVTRQGLVEYNDMNDKLIEIISLKNRLMPGPLDIRSTRMIHMALYDLDTFRAHIFVKGLSEDVGMSLLGNTNLKDTLSHTTEYDDTELLLFGMNWIKQTLFGVDCNI